MTTSWAREARARRGRRAGNPGGRPAGQQPPPPVPGHWRLSHYTSEQVCHLAGVTYRQLDYWASTGLVAPARPGGGSGPGIVRSWTQADLVRVRAIARMLNLGLSLQRVRALVADGNHVIVQTVPLPTALDQEPA
jgi:hypothetical protein